MTLVPRNMPWFTIWLIQILKKSVENTVMVFWGWRQSTILTKIHLMLRMCFFGGGRKITRYLQRIWLEMQMVKTCFLSVMLIWKLPSLCVVEEPASLHPGQAARSVNKASHIEPNPGIHRVSKKIKWQSAYLNSLRRRWFTPGHLQDLEKSKRTLIFIKRHFSQKSRK